MIMGIFVIIASVIVGLASAESDNKTLFIISFMSGVVGVYMMIAAEAVQGEATVSTIRTNDVLVSSTLLKTCKPIELTVKTTVYPGWTNKSTVKDTLSVRIINE